MELTTTLSVLLSFTIAITVVSAGPTRGQSVACVQQPKDIFLVVDGSASIGRANFGQVRNFLSGLIGSFHIEKTMTHVGLLQFSNEKNIEIEFGLDSFYDANAAQERIQNLIYQSGDDTRTDLALDKVNKEVFTPSGGDRSDVQNVVLLFTDGNARKKDLTIEIAETLKKKGVRIIAIGAGDELLGFKEQLEMIASDPADVKIVGFDKLADIVVDVSEEVCRIITPPPTPSAAPTTTQLPETTKPETTKPPKTDQRELAPPKPEPKLTPVCGDNPKDVIFVVDGTENYAAPVHRENKHFSKIKGFIKKIVSNLGDKFTVGVMQYGKKGEANMEVELSAGKSIAELKKSIRGIQQQKGKERWTGEALVKASNKFYELDVVHNRQYYPKVIVLITRGLPSDPLTVAGETRLYQLRGIRLITVAVGLRPQKLDTYLNAISSPHDSLFYKYSKLKKGSQDVVKKLCESRADQPALLTEERLCHRTPHDIFFLVDGSASMKYPNFEKMKKFLMDFISLLQVDYSDINTGLMQFSETGETSLIWKLDSTSEQSAVHDIQTMRYQSGKSTMTGNALTRVNKIFNGKDGDRPDVKDVLLILTDGGAHDGKLARETAKILKAKGVTVIAIGAGSEGNIRKFKSELEDMASSPQHVLTVDFDELDVFAETAFPLICRDF